MTRGEYEQSRQKIISARRSLSMSIRQSYHKGRKYLSELQAKLDSLPATPARLPDVYGYELAEQDGAYAGFTFDKSEAMELAELHGYKVKRCITKRPTSWMAVV